MMAVFLSGIHGSDDMLIKVKENTAQVLGKDYIIGVESTG